MDIYDKEFLEIEINSIVKEMTKKTYEKIVKTQGFSIYYYEKYVDIFILEKEEINELESELKEIVNENSVLFYKDKTSDERAESINGSDNEKIEKIIKIIKSEDFREKKSKIRIKRK
jgi:hypothetical protein